MVLIAVLDCLWLGYIIARWICRSTVEPAHNGQTKLQTKSTIRDRWLLRATATYEIIFMVRIKKKGTP